ncbi:hypothetical protein LINPERHAP2_LOCUS18120 [Linum perenne]
MLVEFSASLIPLENLPVGSTVKRIRANLCRAKILSAANYSPPSLLVLFTLLNLLIICFPDILQCQISYVLDTEDYLFRTRQKGRRTLPQNGSSSLNQEKTCQRIERFRRWLK